MNKFAYTILSLFFLFLVSSSSVRGEELLDFDLDLLETVENQLGSEKKLERNVLSRDAYDFGEHLYEAEAFLDLREGKQTAVWKKGGLVFENVKDPNATIRSETTFVGLEKRVAVITFNPTAHIKKQLRYFDVPAGTRLMLYYEYEDRSSTVKMGGSKSKKKQGAIDFSVSVGQHSLKRIIISPREGWKDMQIDLGLVSFLNGKVPVTFEVVGDEFPGLFRFYARVDAQ